LNVKKNLRIFQEYPSLLERIQKINHSDLYRASFLKKISENSYALIASQYTIEQITEHYYYYPWHQSREGRFAAIGGFPVRKRLNKPLKNKLRKL
jgi:hypothetical protein